MRAVHVIAARRTPVGRLGGALATVRPDDLAVQVIPGPLADLQQLAPARLDDVYRGAANRAGEDRGQPQRHPDGGAAGRAARPGTGGHGQPLCASPLEAVTSAVRAIAAGDSDLVRAAGPMYRLNRTGTHRALANLCVGVGQGTTVLVERD